MKFSTKQELFNHILAAPDADRKMALISEHADSLSAQELEELSFKLIDDLQQTLSIAPAVDETVFSPPRVALECDHVQEAALHSRAGVEATSPHEEPVEAVKATKADAVAATNAQIRQLASKAKQRAKLRLRNVRIGWARSIAVAIALNGFAILGAMLLLGPAAVIFAPLVAWILIAATGFRRTETMGGLIVSLAAFLAVGSHLLESLVVAPMAALFDSNLSGDSPALALTVLLVFLITAFWRALDQKKHRAAPAAV